MPARARGALDAPDATAAAVDGEAVAGAQLDVAEVGDGLAGVIRFFPLQVGGAPAVLLGPIAVRPDFEGEGIGGSLVTRGLDAARLAGHGHVIAVGSAGYLGRFGFQAAVDVGLPVPEGIPAERYLSLRLDHAERAERPIAKRATSRR